mgnify:CR=1 FL=1
MVLDIIIGLIMIGAMMYGLRKGFVFTFIHTVGWIVAAVLAYLATPFVKNFLNANTTIYASLQDDLSNRFSDSLPALDSSSQSIPSNIETILSNLSDSTASEAGKIFANIIFTVMIFMAVFIIIKIVLWLILRLLSKDYRHGFTGFADGFFGLVMGFIKGAVMVFIFLALLLPVTSMVAPDHSQAIVDSLNNSIFAKDLYDNNFILLLLGSFFG